MVYLMAYLEKAQTDFLVPSGPSLCRFLGDPVTVKLHYTI